MEVAQEEDVVAFGEAALGVAADGGLGEAAAVPEVGAGEAALGELTRRRARAAGMRLARKRLKPLFARRRQPRYCQSSATRPSPWTAR